MKNYKLFVSYLFLILVCGFFIRYQYNNKVIKRYPTRGDASQYYIYAYNMYIYNIFSKQVVRKNQTPRADSFRSPGYPLLIVRHSNNSAV